MQDRIDHLIERIDQQNGSMLQMAEQIVDLKDKLKRLELIEEAESEALHKMRGECAAMVIEAQHKHLRCAIENGCPKDFAV